MSWLGRNGIGLPEIYFFLISACCWPVYLAVSSQVHVLTRVSLIKRLDLCSSMVHIEISNFVSTAWAIIMNTGPIWEIT